MKSNHFVLVAVIISLFIQSCEKDTGAYPGDLSDKVSHNTGAVFAKLNGKPWAATVARAHYWQGGVSMVIEHYLNEELHEALSLSYINPLLQKNAVRYHNPVTYEKGNVNGAEALFGISEDDAVVADYNVIPDSFANNYIEILSYNEAEREIQGRFQISFYLAGTVKNGVYDTVRLTDGVFSLKIK